MSIASLQRAGTTMILALSFLASAVIFGTSGQARADEAEWLKTAFENRASPKAMKLGVTQSGRKARRGKKGVEVASLGNFVPGPTAPAPSLSGGGNVRWVASASCLNGTLAGIISSLASFGAITVSSTCRSHSHNRRVGGARKSHHLTGNAVDFRLSGNVRGAMAYLSSSGSVGGIKHYGGGLFHIDTGPRRSW